MSTSPRADLPCHVWVQLEVGEAFRPGLLVRWERGEQGWLGDVAIVGDSGAPGLQLVPAERLRPAVGVAPRML